MPETFNLRGNVELTARIVAVLIGIIVYLLGHYVNGFTILADAGAAFIGAAVALLLDILIKILAFRSAGPIQSLQIFSSFVSAAETELNQIQYYRTDQRVTISVKKVEEKRYEIVMELTASLVPVSYSVPFWIDKQKVGPPSNDRIKPACEARTTEANYFINGIELLDDRRQIGGVITKSARTTDRWKIRHELHGSEIISVEDDHYWPSSVSDFVVFYEGSNDFNFRVSAVRGRGEEDVLEGRSVGAGIQEFRGKGAAFAGQILRWKITRKN